MSRIFTAQEVKDLIERGYLAYSNSDEAEKEKLKQELEAEGSEDVFSWAGAVWRAVKRACNGSKPKEFAYRTWVGNVRYYEEMGWKVEKDLGNMASDGAYALVCYCEI